MSAVTRYLMQRAIKHFPRLDYLDDAAVRHNRRQWLASVDYLRRSRGWVAEGAVGWKIGQEREAA